MIGIFFFFAVIIMQVAGVNNPVYYIGIFLIFFFFAINEKRMEQRLVNSQKMEFTSYYFYFSTIFASITVISYLMAYYTHIYFIKNLKTIQLFFVAQILFLIIAYFFNRRKRGKREVVDFEQLKLKKDIVNLKSKIYYPIFNEDGEVTDIFFDRNKALGYFLAVRASKISGGKLPQKVKNFLKNLIERIKK